MEVSMSATNWFAWPSGLMLTLFNECVCGIRIGESVVIDPAIPEGWKCVESPVYTIRGRSVQVLHKTGETRVLVDGGLGAPPVVIN